MEVVNEFIGELGKAVEKRIGLYQKAIRFLRDRQEISHYLSHFNTENEDEILLLRSEFSWFDCAILILEGHGNELIEYGVEIIEEARLHLRLYYDIAVRKRIVIEFRKQESRIKLVVNAKAAGISGNLPPDIPIPTDFIIGKEQISLALEPDPSNEKLYIGLVGGKPATRSKINLEVCYHNGEKDIFYGKDISHAGVWVIEIEKAGRISSINVICL